jgi:DNA-binding XRE family transcriptional regulator
MGKARQTDGVPYTMKLSDGRTVYVEVPAQYVVRDAGGGRTFTVAGVRFLDRVRALAMRTPAAPTPGYLRTLREALGLTQQQFGEFVGVDKMTVWRWEKGQLRPGADSVKAIDAARRAAARKGVLLAG